MDVPQAQGSDVSFFLSLSFFLSFTHTISSPLASLIVPPPPLSLSSPLVLSPLLNLRNDTLFSFSFWPYYSLSFITCFSCTSRRTSCINLLYTEQWSSLLMHIYIPLFLPHFGSTVKWDFGKMWFCPFSSFFIKKIHRVLTKKVLV